MKLGDSIHLYWATREKCHVINGGGISFVIQCLTHTPTLRWHFNFSQSFLSSVFYYIILCTAGFWGGFFKIFFFQLPPTNNTTFVSTALIAFGHLPVHHFNILFSIQYLSQTTHKSTKHSIWFFYLIVLYPSYLNTQMICMWNLYIQFKCYVLHIVTAAVFCSWFDNSFHSTWFM